MLSALDCVKVALGLSHPLCLQCPKWSLVSARLALSGFVCKYVLVYNIADHCA